MNDNRAPTSYLSVVQLCRRWDVSEKTVYQLIHDKQLRAFRRGKRKWGVALAEIERYEKTRAA
jgi:excisionase family DNA binding protein